MFVKGAQQYQNDKGQAEGHFSPQESPQAPSQLLQPPSSYYLLISTMISLLYLFLSFFFFFFDFL